MTATSTMNRSRMFRVGITLASVAAMGLSACGSDDGDTSDAAATTTSKKSESSTTPASKKVKEGSSPMNPLKMEGSEIDLPNGLTVSISNVRTDVSGNEINGNASVETCPRDTTYPLAMDISVVNSTPGSEPVRVADEIVSLVDQDHMDSQPMMPTINGGCGSPSPDSWVMNDYDGITLPHGDKFKYSYTTYFTNISAERVGALKLSVKGGENIVTTVGDLPLGENAS